MLAKEQQECFIQYLITISLSTQKHSGHRKYGGQILIIKIKKKVKSDSTKNASSGYQPENHTLHEYQMTIKSNWLGREINQLGAVRFHKLDEVQFKS